MMAPPYLLSVDLFESGSYNVCRKEASGLRLLSSLLYTQGVRGSSPLPPSIEAKGGHLDAPALFAIKHI